MTRIVGFNDLHAHEFPTHGELVPGKGQSRLLDALAILDQITAYADREGIQYGLCLGDVFHLHERLLVSALAGVLRWARGERERGRSWWLIPGNHDWDQLGLFHALEALRGESFRVVDTIDEIEIEGHRILLVPWQRKAAEVRVPVKQQKQYSAIGFHHDFADVPYRGRLIGRGGSHTAFTDTFAVSGHYHDEIRMSDTFLYPGAPLQHDEGDRGKKRGFWELELPPATKDRDLPTLRRIPTVYPKFKRLSVARVLRLVETKKLRKIVEGHFIQVIRAGTAQTAEALQFVAEYNPRVVEPVSLTLVEPDADATVEVIDDDELDLDQVVDEYVEANAPQDLSRRRLKKIGKRTLRQIGG